MRFFLQERDLCMLLPDDQILYILWISPVESSVWQFPVSILRFIQYLLGPNLPKALPPYSNSYRSRH
jgi:hypothetical protein